MRIAEVENTIAFLRKHEWGGQKGCKAIALYFSQKFNVKCMLSRSTESGYIYVFDRKGKWRKIRISRHPNRKDTPLNVMVSGSNYMVAKRLIRSVEAAYLGVSNYREYTIKQKEHHKEIYQKAREIYFPTKTVYHTVPN